MMTTTRRPSAVTSYSEMTTGGTIAMSTEIEYRIERLRAETGRDRLAVGTERRGLRRAIGRALIGAGRALQGLDVPRETPEPGCQPLAGHA